MRSTPGSRKQSPMQPGAILCFLSPKVAKTPLASPVIRLAPSSAVSPSATPSPVKTGEATTSKCTKTIPKEEKLAPKKIVENSRLSKKLTSSSLTKRSTKRIVQNENEGNVSDPSGAVKPKREAEKRNIDQVNGVDRLNVAKRPHNSSRPTSLDKTDTRLTSKRLYGFIRVLPGEISDNASIHHSQPQEAKSPTIVEVEPGYILGRGPQSNKCLSFKSLGIEASCDGVSRQQVRILRVCPDQGGLDLECCSNAKNRLGIVPYQVNSSSSQRKQLYLHGSNEINGVQYVIPGKSARIHVNDWVVFDLYRRVPTQVFRLVCLKDELHSSLITRKANEKTVAMSTAPISENDADLGATQDMFFSCNSQTMNYVNSNNVASTKEMSVNETHAFKRSSIGHEEYSSLITVNDAEAKEKQEAERKEVSDVNDSNGAVAVIRKESNGEKNKASKATFISSDSTQSLTTDLAGYAINDAALVSDGPEFSKVTLAASDESVVKANHDSAVGDELVVAGKCNISPPLLDFNGISSSLERECAHRSGGSIENNCEEANNNTAIAATYDSPLKSSTSIIGMQSKVAISELHPSLSKLFWRSINSAEPDNGVSFLTELQCLHSFVPGKVMSRQIFELLIDGPTSEGYSYFDPNKSEVVYEYAAKLVGNNSGFSFGPDWDAISGLYSRISKIHAIDYGSHDTFCILQQVACALEFLLVLIENDLSTLKHFPKNEVKEFLRARVSFSFFLNPAGIRESLKQTAKLAMQFHIWSEKATIDPKEEEGENYEFCTQTAFRCRKGLCKLTCLVSSLFCLYEGINLDSNDLSFLLKDAMEAELSSIQRKTIEQRRIKVSFLVYFHLADDTNLFISRLVTLLRLTKELSFMVE